MAKRKNKTSKGSKIISFNKGKQSLFNLKTMVKSFPKSKSRHNIWLACEADVVAIKKRLLVEKDPVKILDLQIELCNKKIEWNEAAIAFFISIPRDSMPKQVESIRKRLVARIKELRQAVKAEKANLKASEARKRLLAEH